MTGGLGTTSWAPVLVTAGDQEKFPWAKGHFAHATIQAWPLGPEEPWTLWGVGKILEAEGPNSLELRCTPTLARFH